MTTTRPADRDRAIGTIVLAFANDPPARWVFPEPSDYLAHFPTFTRAFGGGAVDHGSSYHAEGFGGVALWLPPGAHPDEKVLMDLFERAVPPVRRQHVYALLEQMGRYHPEGPHWYLPMIGVDPALQGRGIGSGLLAHALRRVDQDHLPAYLESTNPKNVPLYQRHGFEVLDTLRVADCPPIVPMLRAAR